MMANNNITPEALKDLMQYLEKNKGIIKYQYGDTHDPYNILSQGVQGLDQGVNVPQNPYTGAFNTSMFGNFGNGNIQQGQNDWSTNDPIYEELSKKDPRELTRSETQYLNDRAQSYKPAGQNSFMEGISNQYSGGNPPITGSQGDNYGWTDEQVKEYRRREDEKVNEAMGKGTTQGNGYVNEKGQLVGGSSDGSKYEKDQNGQFVNAMKDYSGLGLIGGQDMNSTAYNMGRFIGAPKGTKGKGLGIAAAGLSLALKGARGVAAGMGHANLEKEARRWEMQQMAKRKFTPDSQWEDNNYMGGNTFQDGGEQMQQQQGDQMQQILQMADQMFQQGYQPVEVASQLIQQGVPVEAIPQIFGQLGLPEEDIQLVMEQLMQAQAPQQRYGGLFGTVDSFQDGGPKVTPRSIEEMRINRERFNLINAGVDPRTGETVQLYPEDTEMGQLQREYAKYKQENYPNASDQDREERYLEWERLQRSKLGNFSKGTPRKLNTLDLKGLTFQDGGVQGQSTNMMYRVGEPIEFEYGGKMVKGTVKKVENGKIYI